jgi:transcriptional regulator with XRE-family HTH domain
VPRARTTKPVTPEAAIFGERLHELRTKRGLTIEALADDIEMSRTYVSNLEVGAKVPSLTTLLRLAAALDCNVTDLVKVFNGRDLRALVKKRR